MTAASELPLFFVLRDYRVDHIGLVARGDLLADESPYSLRLIVTDLVGLDGRAAGRKFVEHAEIEVAIQGKR